MFAVLSLIVIVTVSMLVTRVAAIALTHTGLSRQTARFQARSAFTGVGFTTAESEQVVNHPVRRRILLLLMLLGNAGIVTAVSSLILTFVQTGSTTRLALKIVLLTAGIVILWALASSAWVDRRLSLLIERLLKRYTRLEVQDYASLLHLAGDYRVTELQVQEGDWLAQQPLTDLNLREEGVLVLGIERKDGTYLGTPGGDTCLYAGDVALLYGRTSELEALDQRREGFWGDRAHHRAVREQRRIAQQEREAEEKKMAPDGGR